MPYPDLDELQQYNSFEEAMEAYALYAKNSGYTYLVSWRPWLHVASSIRKAFQEGPADIAQNEHFSKRMSDLRNHTVTNVFGEDGMDRLGTSLAVFNTALRAAEQNGTLAAFVAPSLPYLEGDSADADEYLPYDPSAAPIAAPGDVNGDAHDSQSGSGDEESEFEESIEYADGDPENELNDGDDADAANEDGGDPASHPEGAANAGAGDGADTAGVDGGDSSMSRRSEAPSPPASILLNPGRRGRSTERVGEGGSGRARGGSQSRVQWTREVSGGDDTQDHRADAEPRGRSGNVQRRLDFDSTGLDERVHGDSNMSRDDGLNAAGISDRGDSNVSREEERKALGDSSGVASDVRAASAVRTSSVSRPIPGSGTGLGPTKLVTHRSTRT